MRTAWNNERGVITLVSLCLTAVIGIVLGSYIALCYQSLAHSTRSLHLMRARQLAETGIEQALWSLSQAADPVPANAATAWSNASWTTTGSNKTCTLSGFNLNQGAAGSVALTIVNYAGTTPAITAVATVTTASGSFTKTLTATTQYAPLFGNAIAACGNSTLSSFYYRRVRFQGGGTVDSYNSNPLTGGGQYGGANVGYAAVVASSETDSSRTGITLGTAQVNGYLTTSGAIFSTGTGKLKGPSTPVGTTVDTTRMGKSAFTPEFDIVEPTGTSTVLSGLNQTIGNPGDTTPAFYRYDTSLSYDPGETLTVDGPVYMLVKGDFTLQGGGQIYITPNGSLELFVRGNVTISGAGGIQNHTSVTNPLPSKVALYCGYYAGSSPTFTYNATNDFYGVLYCASSSSFSTMSFSTNAKFFGAILADYRVNFATGTTPLIHYDTALRTARFSRIRTPYLVNQVTEQ